MTSPLSVISAGNFFSGVMREYSSLGWPGATEVGMNSILSIRPSSIAGMRTLRANGEEGENASFVRYSLKNTPEFNRHCERSEAIQRAARVDCFVAYAPRNDD